MQVKRLLFKQLTQEHFVFLIMLIIAVVVYLLRLRSTRDFGIFSVSDNLFVNPMIMWQSRVKSNCQGKTDIRESRKNEANLNLLGIVRNKQDKYVRDIGYKIHAFNTLVSNNIGPFREIVDTRHKVCRNSSHTESLPKVSIVMCFYNEHKMTLIRSLKSILVRTPAELLKEIILVDDFSDLPELEFHLLLDLNVQLKYGNLKYIRNEKREGLIRSRVIGAREAIGEVIVFLDSHIEVNKEWIQPLLSLIQKENSTLAVPVIDLINADTFEYTPSPLVRGGFNWGLHFKWENLPQGTLKEESDFKGPFISPTMAGGLFAVNRNYFKYIGEYDLGMDIWGGENLEISFRVWQCGGAVKIVPCARVGHIFRKRRPYSAPNGENTMLKNSLRLAYVWMDDYKEYYFKHEKIPKDFNYGDITDRLKLRESLKCRSFEWYLKNIYSELRLPGQGGEKPPGLESSFQPWHSRKRQYLKSYTLRLANTDLCLSAPTLKLKGFWKKGTTLFLLQCGDGSRNQIWYETEKSEIILDKLLCLEGNDDASVQITKCHEMFGNQQWRHTNAKSSPVYNMATGTCLSAQKEVAHSRVLLDLCTKNSKNTWEFVMA